MITQIDDNFHYTKRKSKKTQILLCDTLRPYSYYINSVRYRYDGKNKKIPHYVVTKRGEIFNLMPSEYSSNFLKSKGTIVICLENLGWFNKSTLAPMYVNWIGDVYRGEPHCARWKDRFFWDVYTSDQIIALANLVELATRKASRYPRPSSTILRKFQIQPSLLVFLLVVIIVIFIQI
jgi:hypothetical protein